MSSQQLNQKQRINMTHGFMKSVIKNQIDRDNYDKEVKAKQHSKPSYRPTRNSKRPKKPEIQTYVPPQRLRQEDNGYDVIFTLEYEHKDGELLKIEVCKNECPRHIAKKVGSKFNLSEEFIEAMSDLLQSEIDARGV